MKQILFALFLLLVAWPAAHSASSSKPGLVAQAAHPQWLALLQYQRSDWDGKLRSEVDADGFFLSAKGKTSAADELDENIRQFTAHAELQCRFPARAQWLYQQQLLPTLAIDAASCPELNHWLEDFNAEHVSLIFPAAYLNSPSSMFGHLFLRVDQVDQNENNRLLAKTINFAANVDFDDPELVYAYRGLFGGYPGVVTVMPYYQKVREYSELENRDIWEYQLNLEPEEIQRLLLHTWELLPITFDYYFFDENCAYRILTLLDAARPSLQMTSQFYTYAIPSDTLRTVVTSGLVKEVRFRPSLATELRHKSEQFPGEHHPLALALADPQEAPEQLLAGLEDNQLKAAALEVAFDLQRYRAQQRQMPRNTVADASLKLLKLRSQVTAASPFSAPTIPLVRDDQGHQTFQVTLSRGQREQVETTLLRVRPAYHDLLDPPAGYPQGAQIKFLETAIAFRETGTVRLEDFTGLNITSLSPRDDFFKPLSWRVDAGLYRKFLKDGDDPLIPTFNVGAGHSYQQGNQQFYLLAETQLQQHHQLPSNYAASVGAHGGWLSRYEHWQQHLSLQFNSAVSGYHHNYQVLNWKLSYHFGLNLSLVGEMKLTHTEGEYFHQHQLGVEWRF
ncbi:MAG: DUF4105 domain-containing protein [Gammaproteobacteria bacterium]|nr:MAG: DUF4105 domain-containing protein [Gammaproteobacteria bacterium]